ncbi:unnamed protein product [Cuscuta epithymum]|uniref:DUF868 domain-containing protein n=1 Tax=Cuscuta epithymum TaxID=186058 RepID=A0AAV0CS15_9ASTE|nr:unnamed protein product [Cuscuta epithymum]
MIAKQHHSSHFPSPSCFRPSNSAASGGGGGSRSSKVAPPIPAAPTLATSLYHTDLGIIAVTWSRSMLGRSFHLHFSLDDAAEEDDGVSTPAVASLAATPSFHLHIKPFVFWKKQGSKRVQISCGGKIRNGHIFWDLSRAKFGSGPEPRSGFFIAVVIDGEIVLLVGDSHKEAYSKTRARIPGEGAGPGQTMVLKREHVYGSKLYVTEATIGGKHRNICIECRISGDDPRLYFYVENKRVLQIKHLKWKFRGNERIVIDGFPIHISWDVHNWLFEDDDDGYALFMFKFENEDDGGDHSRAGKAVKSCGFGFETKMMKKGLLRTARSSSSTSLSSASSSCSSVIEWASTEENELKGPTGFSLLVYAWKS